MIKGELCKEATMSVIEPIQTAYLAEFLLSDKAKHITGAAIPVSSGVKNK